MEGLMGVGEKQHEYEFHALIFFCIFDFLLGNTYNLVHTSR